MMPPRCLKHKLRAWTRLSRFEQMWFGPVWLLLGLSRLAIMTVRFRRLAPLLGHHAQNLLVIPLVSEQQCDRARRIGRVVRLASRYTPWCSNCFPQAITARLMLCIYGVPHALFFALVRGMGGTEALRAHVWVCAGPVAATGGNCFRTSTVVCTFVSTDLTASGGDRAEKGRTIQISS